MKNRIFILVVLLISIIAMAGVPAQISSFIYGSNPYYTANDTISDSNTHILYAPVNPFRHSIGFQLNIRPISGKRGNINISVFGSIMGNESEYVIIGAPFYFNPGFDTMRTGYIDMPHNGEYAPWGNQYAKYIIKIKADSIETYSLQAFCLIR